MHSSRMRTTHFSCHRGGGGIFLGRGVSAQGAERCKNNTLPQTSFAGGKKIKVHDIRYDA